ncbi:MAG: hypothetical protein RIM99_05290 [Cyclobacteriaceae bacterium]
MRKSVFTLLIAVLSIGFMSCEQEEVAPVADEPTIEYTEGSEDEESGDRPSGN